MYKIGDYVMYGMRGVCKVLDITEVDFSEKGKLYYKLVPEYDKNDEIYVSIQNGKKKMHTLISRDEAVKIMESIPKKKGRWISDDRERDRIHKQILMNREYSQMIEIIIGLTKKCKKRLGQGKRQTELDDRIFRNIKRVFFGELAIALDKSPDEIEKEILKNIKS